MDKLKESYDTPQLVVHELLRDITASNSGRSSERVVPHGRQLAGQRMVRE